MDTNGNGKCGHDDLLIALFSMEIAIPGFKIVAGGQGYLVWDMLKSAYAQGISMVGVTLLNHFGYGDQIKNGHGMEYKYVYRDYKDILEDIGLTFPINICPYPTWAKGLNWVRVWKLPEGRFGSVPIFLLDTDIPENDALARMNSMYLYGGISTCENDQINLDQRNIAQSLLLGKGGVKTLRRLTKMGQIKPVSKYHLNEAHAAFGALEVFSDNIKKLGDIQKAVETTRSHVVFTTHTPIKAGNPEYDLELVCKMAGVNGESNGLTRDILMQLGGERFNMAATAIRLSGKWNAVSKRHLEVVKEMWGWLGNSSSDKENVPDEVLSTKVNWKRILAAVDPISVTNGVSRDWQWPEFSPEHTSSYEHHAAKQKYKELINQRAVSEHEQPLVENIPWLVWARRGASYKRIDLMFKDDEWLRENLQQHKFALVISSKPHPDDTKQILLWNDIYALSKDRRNYPNIVVLADYDPELSKLLKGCADVWVNTPRASHESSGTSPMSAAMNEALIVSTPDGYLCRDVNHKNYFLFGSAYPMQNTGTQDMYDGEELKTAIGNAIMMHCNEEEAHRMRLAAKKEAVEYFNTDRVVREYNALMYTSAN